MWTQTHNQNVYRGSNQTRNGNFINSIKKEDEFSDKTENIKIW